VYYLHLLDLPQLIQNRRWRVRGGICLLASLHNAGDARDFSHDMLQFALKGSNVFGHYPSPKMVYIQFEFSAINWTDTSNQLKTTPSGDFES
jgi:hypothetical protein